MISLKKSSSSKVFILLCMQCVITASLQIPRSAIHSPATRPVFDHRTNTLYARQNNLGAQSIGIKTYPLTEPITAQAVGGVLIQALATAWNRYGLVPNEDRDIFTFSEASSQFFNVGITITASPQSNATGGHPFTNDHAVTTLSLLGYEFSNQQNLSDLVEYNFDVVVDKWMQPEVIIATGSIYNKPSNNAQSSS